MDGLPRTGLGRGGRREGAREPGAGRGREAVQGSGCFAGHASIVHPGTDNGRPPRFRLPFRGGPRDRTMAV
ncbi:hypothetical protein STAFG_7470 [Streptomyces afghaniensis 772]|uniref:Uncharacterized protein n=1 Tax=Streptomyces afghaniensis 772 TaxID=1283301 RepID=S4NBL1_9ACTN|nr:hypothetical protein STAFG_7470 [Streptomyces afghaniensis 772]